MGQVSIENTVKGDNQPNIKVGLKNKERKNEVKIGWEEERCRKLISELNPQCDEREEERRWRIEIVVVWEGIT